MSDAKSPAATPPGARPGFRPDVQGLRAIAVLAVVIYHVAPNRLPGGYIGVDVFFIISGFLITGLLLREAERDHRISLSQFWARRAKRILPAAAVVLLFVAIGTLLVLPQTRWVDTGWQIVSSATYVQNWVLAGGTDYLNADVPATPLQHFWSLAVEEQFYLVWPLLVILALALAGGRRASGPRQRAFALGGILLVVVPSFVWSIVETSINPAPAYFVTTTRVWELGIGALVAVLAPQLARIPRVVAGIIGWLGLLGIVAACLLFSDATPFPGSAALLPTLAASAIIIAGMSSPPRWGIGTVLAIRPATWIGDLSYSLYLWHWPMLIIGGFLLGHEWTPLIAVAAIVPAWLSRRFVEQPVLKAPYFQGRVARPLIGAVAVVAFAAATSGVLWVGVARAITPPASAPGAVAVETDPHATDPVATLPDGFTPSVVTAHDDNPDLYADGCFLEIDETTPRFCTYGPKSASYTVGLIGDSHTAQWAPALQRLADQRDFRLVVSGKSRCPVTEAQLLLVGAPGYDKTCVDWNRNIMKWMTSDDGPDFVIMSGAGYESTSDMSVHIGYEKAWSTLKQADIPFAVIMDSPKMGDDVPECVAEHMDDLTQCAIPTSTALPNGGADLKQAAQALDAPVIDMTKYLCSDDWCPPIVGGVLIYRDEGHIGKTYGETLAHPLGLAIDKLHVRPLTGRR